MRIYTLIIKNVMNFGNSWSMLFCKIWASEFKIMDLW